MTDRDRLIELIEKWFENPQGFTYLADYLLSNGVRVIDTKFINPENRELITHFAGMPINDVLDLVRAKKEGRLIVPPCKVGDTVYVITSDSPTGIEETKVSQIKIKVKENGEISYRISAPCVYDTWGDAHWTFCAFEFGKTVFLTKEEAEEKLKEREKNEL